MDTSRLIESIEIEFDTSSNFDDLNIKSGTDTYNCQMKDFIDVKLEDLSIINDSILIKGNEHKLSEHTNILFFKFIDITTNSEILNLPALKLENVYIISLSRKKCRELISGLYRNDKIRELEIQSFFESCMDKRLRIISKVDLPIINIFRKELYEPTIRVGSIPTLEQNELLIIGKPGIGKSHLVNVIRDKFENVLLYRFWISNQDKDYENRLKYDNFIYDISKELFSKQELRTESEIVEKLQKDDIVTIIDGLDHVENYNPNELSQFIDFFDSVKVNSRIIIFTRPLKFEFKYNSINLIEWTESQTSTVLEELYHISDYETKKKIFELTKGYPLLVRYISVHFKEFKILPELEDLSDLDAYYTQIISRIDSKKALTLFLTNHSFFMYSEISSLQGDELSQIILDIIEANPYLFDIKLNRITLFHDSFITFLRKDNTFITAKEQTINTEVIRSMLSLDTKYLSRYSYFNFDKSEKLQVIEKYSSMSTFTNILNKTIDYEAIVTFYSQLRESLLDIDFNELELINYYDLSLIINILNRDHLSSILEFYYVLVKSLIYNGISEDEITSNGYLFSMFIYFKKNDPLPLLKITNNYNYGTDNFYEELSNTISNEDNYFYEGDFNITEEKFLELMKNEAGYDSRKILIHVLSRIYNIDVEGAILIELKNIITKYIEGSKDEAIFELKSAITKFNYTTVLLKNILEEAKDDIESQGFDYPQNDYLYKSLNEIILEYNQFGSFYLWPKILNKLRLDLKKTTKSTLTDLSKFFPMYFNRKDVTVIDVSTALFVFESYGYIEKKKSCEIINHIQKMSEKGIRYIFNDYINLHEPSILSVIEETLDITNIQIYWFDLPPKYINVFSSSIFDIAMNNLIQQSNYSKELEIGTIENLIESDKWEEAKKILEYLKYTIEMDSNSKYFNLIRNYSKLSIKFIRKEKSNNNIESLEHYNNGYLSKDDIEFIKHKKLSSVEIAKYPDGWYSTFSDISLYQIYDKSELKDKFEEIIYNAITGKIRSINMFGNLYYFIGNIPLFEKTYNDGERIKNMFNSFLDFLKISFITDWDIRKL